MSSRKQQAGDKAERAAEDHLAALGFRVLERNLRVGRDEIDLLVQKDDLVAIVEVRLRGAPRSKARSRASTRRSAASSFARRSVCGASDGRRIPNAPRLRFDVVGVRVDSSRRARIEHIAAAFTA